MDAFDDGGKVLCGDDLLVEVGSRLPLPSFAALELFSICSF